MTLSSTFLTVLIALESHGNHFAVGDGHKSIGALQIQPAVIADVNRIYGYRFSHHDAYDMHKFDIEELTDAGCDGPLAFVKDQLRFEESSR